MSEIAQSIISESKEVPNKLIIAENFESTSVEDNIANTLSEAIESSAFIQGTKGDIRQVLSSMSSNDEQLLQDNNRLKVFAILHLIQPLKKQLDKIGYKQLERSEYIALATSLLKGNSKEDRIQLGFSTLDKDKYTTAYNVWRTNPGGLNGMKEIQNEMASWD